MKLAALLTLFLLIASFGCQILNTAESVKTEIPVGIITPLTGSRADAGESVKNSLELALSEINNNPANKYQIKLIYEDSQYKPALAVNAFYSLSDLRQVKYIIGVHGSSEALAVAPLAEERKIILITPSAQSDELSNSGKYIFRVMSHTAQDGLAYANIISQRARGSTVHFIAIDTDYTTSFMSVFEPEYKRRGGRVGLVEKFGTDENDFKTQLLKLKEAGAEEVMLLGTPKSTAQQLIQASEIGLQANFYGISAIETGDFLNTVGNFAEGILFVTPYNKDSLEEKVQIFQEKYLSAYGKQNDVYGANAYDALMLLSRCLEQEGDDTEKIAGCLSNVRGYAGAGGTFSFDENGDAERRFYLKEIRDGEFRLLNEI